METLVRTPLHRALHRPNLVLGGERELVLLSGLVAGGLVVSALNFIAIVVGIAVWLPCLAFLRMMAAADPQMSRVYRRQLKYRAYYAPRARPFRTE
jgi:type IV secretory pathway TrbD component